MVWRLPHGMEVAGGMIAGYTLINYDEFCSGKDALDDIDVRMSK